jgi:dTDP-glucose 4,6-dehydratase
MIHNALSGKPLPVYGDGMNIRDWLFVTDHCEALRQVIHKGVAGQTYNIGGESQKTNLEVVSEICAILSELRPGPGYESLIEFVQDRPGHDRRYAVDITKIRQDIGWSPKDSFSSGLRKTVSWYLNNPQWMESVTSGSYRQWIETHYQNPQQHSAHAR